MDQDEDEGNGKDQELEEKGGTSSGSTEDKKGMPTPPLPAFLQEPHGGDGSGVQSDEDEEITAEQIRRRR